MSKNIALLALTPHQVHLMKNIYKLLINNNHNVIYLVRDYNITVKLLDELQLNYTLISKEKLVSKEIYNLFFKTYSYLKNNDINFVIGDSTLGIPSFAKKIPSIALTNMDANFLYPFFYKYISKNNYVLTPSHYRYNLGKKHIKYSGYQQLAYLNPKYYTPNKKIYDYLDLDFDEKYCVVRLNAFDAYSHDFQLRSLSENELDHLIESLKPIGKVIIIPESKISSKYNKYVLNFPVHMIFDLLFYSDLLCTETAMATESIILGTPTILVHQKASNFSDFITLKNFGLKICNINYLLKKAAPLFKIGKNKNLSFEQIYYSNFNRADDPNIIVMKILNSLL